jgi:hypothetical protein
MEARHADRESQRADCLYPLGALGRGDGTRRRGGFTLSKGGRSRALSVLCSLCVQAGRKVALRDASRSLCFGPTEFSKTLSLQDFLDNPATRPDPACIAG